MSTLGNIIILIASWLLLRTKGEGFSALFGSHFLYRFLQFIAGTVCTAFLAGMLSMLFSAMANFSWQPAVGLGIGFLLKGVYNTLSSVLFEALLFRGALLYMAINLIGEKRANLISAFAYAIYHWFTLHVFGNPAIMLWVLVYMGLWGLMFAYAYSRTGSLALPIGLHFGWNFINECIFNRHGDGLFTIIKTVHTRYLNTLEEMLFLSLPSIAFSVALIVLLCQYFPVKVYASKSKTVE